jgi:hypothetical protein
MDMFCRDTDKSSPFFVIATPANAYKSRSVIAELSAVYYLLSAGSPSAISWLIVTINVDAINRVATRRTRANIVDKLLE